VALSGGDQAIDVRWRPAEANGSPLTGYVVTAEPGGHRQEVPADATSAAIDGLVNGYGITPDADYTVTVVARNAVGAGPGSAPKTVRLKGPTIGPISVRSMGGTAVAISFTVDWRGSTPNGCDVTVKGNPAGDLMSFGGPCGDTQLDLALYDFTFSISARAAYVAPGNRGQGVESAPITYRTPPDGRSDVPRVHLTLSKNASPEDWFYGTPQEGNRYADVQESGIWVYPTQRPGTQQLERWTNGQPNVHWFGLGGRQPPGFTREAVLGYVFGVPAPGRPAIHSFERPDPGGPGQGLDCFLPAMPSQYAQAGPGGWTDNGVIGCGALPP
jgi:hypothetical protein